MSERDYSDYYRQENSEKDLQSGSLAPFTFICVTVILILTGLLMLYSASYAEAISSGLDHYYFVLRQGIFAVLGIVCAVAVNFIPVKWIKLSAIPLVVIALVSMLLTLFSPYGVTVMGARRWLDLPVIPQFQPSEVVKLSMIIFLAWWLSSPSARKYAGWFYLVPFLLIVLFTALILVQRAYTTGIHFLILTVAVCIAGKLKLRYIASGAAFLFVPGLFYMLSASYRVRRIASFLMPSLDPQGLNWQVNMSLSAIAEGGLTGKGIGNGSYKLGLLPEVQNDFILSSIIEETGLIGFFFIALLFVLFAILGFRAAGRLWKKDRFASLMATGITVMIITQVALNIAVVTALLPPTGIPLPFFSQGGTNLFIVIIECGLLYRMIALAAKRKDEDE